MKRHTILLIASWALVACSEPSSDPTSSEAEPKCLAHAALNGVGCLYEAGNLAGQTRRDAYPVWVFRRILEKRGDNYLLQATQPNASFMVLDTSRLPESETRFGLDSLIGWKTRIIGRYTSADVAAPLVAGAAGTLQAVDIGYLRDPTHPQGPYGNSLADPAIELGNAEARH